ncbi:MAG: GxxExxY protein [Treponema sp.]|nr:GxxExxY protein [Treponema sp.]
MTKTELNELTEKIIGVAIAVHKELGPGLLEKVYQRCLKIALEENGLSVKSEVPVDVIFHGKKITDEALRIDLLVENGVVLELKSVTKLTELFRKQLGTYLKLANKPCGLLINFNEVLLKDGIARVMNGYPK